MFSQKVNSSDTVYQEEMFDTVHSESHVFNIFSEGPRCN